MEKLISLVLTIVLIYIIVGGLFASIFLWKGLTKVDAAARESSFGFKLLILPGLIIFWPLFLYKWIKIKAL